MKKLLAIVLAAMLLLPALAACGSSAETVTLTRTVAAGNSGGASPPSMTSSPAYEGKDSTTTTAAGSITTDRMIVRNGSMSILVEDIPGAVTQIANLAAGVEGYVVSSQNWRSGDRFYGSITIRVPVARFEQVMSQLAGLAVEVTNQSTSSQDVTAEYVDLAAKLKNLEATETQLLSIMQQATKIEDVLAVQRELTTVRSQIEQIKGHMQYLERTSAESLVSINLEQSKLSVKFTANRASAKMNEDIVFTPEIFGGFSPFSYEWDFGDGQTGTQAQPVHKYNRAGTYSVSLKVTDDHGNTLTETRQDYITVIQSGWSLGAVVSGTWGALLWVGRALVTAAVVLAILSPLWLGVGLVIWLIRRRKKAVTG
jgi:PKD repeat protein